MHKVIAQHRTAAFTGGRVIRPADIQAERARDAATVAAILTSIDGTPGPSDDGQPDDGQPHVQPSFVPIVPAAAGRNERCPCGSGKKYKRCHKGKPLAVAET